MKVTITNETKSSEIKYPCLMVDEETGSIVLVLDGHGVALYISSENVRCGTLTSEFCPRGFTPFTGTVELSND